MAALARNDLICCSDQMDFLLMFKVQPLYVYADSPALFDCLSVRLAIINLSCYNTTMQSLADRFQHRFLRSNNNNRSVIKHLLR